MKLLVLCVCVAAFGVCHSLVLDKPPLNNVDGTKTFIFVSDRKVGWQAAQQHCVGLGGNLASIESKADQDAVIAKGQGANADYWIGGNDHAVARSYVWVSNSNPLTYNNFQPGEPNSGPNEHCIAVCRMTYTWFDIQCAAALNFVCETFV